MIRAVSVLILTLGLALGGVTPSLGQGFGAFARVLSSESALRAGQGGTVEIDLTLTQAVPYRVFTVTAPWRVVLDFREVAWDDLGQIALPEGILALDTGAAPGTGWSRMVLTLERPLRPDSVEMVTDPDTGMARVEISLAPSTASRFAETAGAPPGVTMGLEGQVVTSQERDASGAGDVLRVVLDPGHGGIDPGAVRGDRNEADLVLSFARELRDRLRRTGLIEVVMTRDADIFVPLPMRVSRARAAGADLFISIHADALAEGRAEGATVYTLSDTASDAASAALAEQHDRADLLEGIDLAGTEDAVANVLMDLARTETAPRARAFADLLVQEIEVAGVQLHPRPRGEAGFTVLKAADMPSVLLEIGFLSDAGDLQNILDPVWREQMQGAITAAILEWAERDAARSALLRQ